MTSASYPPRRNMSEFVASAQSSPDSRVCAFPLRQLEDLELNRNKPP